MSVHYKFKNTINYDAVKIDGVYISASDLKSIIIQQNKLKNTDVQIENEETGQSYTDDQMIPKNTNIIVSRIPSANANKRAKIAPNANINNGNVNTINSNNHHRHNKHAISSAATSSVQSALSGAIGSADGLATGGGQEALELVSTKNMSEEEKIKHIQSQSTKDFDPARYARSNRAGPYRPRPHTGPGPNYKCRKCGLPGHFVHDCKNSIQKVKRSSGIPRDFLMKVDPHEKGAMMMPSGEYAVPIIDREAYNNPKVEKAPFFEDGTPND